MKCTSQGSVVHVAYNRFVYGLVMNTHTYYTLCNYDCCKEVTIRLQYASTAAQKRKGLSKMLEDLEFSTLEPAEDIFVVVMN